MNTSKFWIVWKANGSVPVKKHNSLAAAKAEAERLCQLGNGNFYVLGAISLASLKHVVWNDLFGQDDAAIGGP